MTPEDNDCRRCPGLRHTGAAFRWEDKLIFDFVVPGGRIVGEVAGDGAPVVLLHAGVADRRMWTYVAPGLAPRRVIRFDFRGFGESPVSTEPYRNSDDLAAVLDHLGVDRADLVGASMGGTVAMEFALRHPHRTGSLVLLATGLPGYDYGPQIREYFAAEEAALERGDIDAVATINQDFWVRGPARPWTDRTRVVADELADPLRTIAGNQIGVDDLEEGGDGVMENLATIAAPTLVVIAESDDVDIVGVGEFVAQSIPGAQCARLPDTGHLPALERPQETLSLIHEFLG